MANNASCALTNTAGEKMKKILVAVDDTKGTKNAFDMYTKACRCIQPESIILTYVEKLEGRSLMDDQLLSVSEMKTLKEALEGTEYQEALDKKANAVVSYYKKKLEDNGMTGVKTVVRKGHPAEEILATAKEEGVDMIIIGSRSRQTSRLFMGSVSREVANSSEIPVLLVK
jgi:nucleotide-binding universal stress UspA family protein